MSLAGPLRILIVDDEPAILRFLKPGLTAEGYLVSEARDGRTALEAIRRKTADLVVLDLGLPDIDGLDVVRQVRARGDTLPIIVLSSRLARSLGERAARKAAISTKP